MGVTIQYVIGTAVTLSDGSELTLSDGEPVELGTWTGDLLVSTSNLGDLVYEVGRELNVLEGGKATSGSTSAIADTNYRTEDDDYWLGGWAVGEQECQRCCDHQSHNKGKKWVLMR